MLFKKLEKSTLNAHPTTKLRFIYRILGDVSMSCRARHCEKGRLVLVLFQLMLLPLLRVHPQCRRGCRLEGLSFSDAQVAVRLLFNRRCLLVLIIRDFQFRFKAGRRDHLNIRNAQFPAIHSLTYFACNQWIVHHLWRIFIKVLLINRIRLVNDDLALSKMFRQNE